MKNLITFITAILLIPPMAVAQRQAMAKQHDYTGGDVGVGLFSEGDIMEVSEVKGWRIKPAYTDEGVAGDGHQ